MNKPEKTKLSVSPPRGMRDILPEEARIRDFAIFRILETYQRYGFCRIETPALENISLLLNSEGGENEKLIFKVLKRGEKLELSTETKHIDDLVDLGLRFDLTVPLVRYYASNRNELPKVFKSLQIGSVWRAERPQRGRFRQFTQCDIDIIGVESELAEIELLLATSEALSQLGFKNFVIRFNDRRILTKWVEYCGFQPEQFDNVFIILDKLDKIGIEGVHDELESCGYEHGAIDNIMQGIAGFLTDAADFAAVKSHLPIEMVADLYQVVERVMHTVQAQAAGRYTIVFDPVLVRGMSYYTGPIFEVEYRDYPFAIAGGGRYDKMIGRLTGVETPACGFSIGFERIITILREEAFAVGTPLAKLVILITPQDMLAEVFATVNHFQQQGFATSVIYQKKKLKKQLNDLALEGYQHFCLFKAGETVQTVEVLESQHE